MGGEKYVTQKNLRPFIH